MKSRQELETVIRRSAADKDWVVFTEDPVIIRRMKRLYGPGRVKSPVGFEWTVPKNRLSIRGTPSAPTEKQLAARAAASKRLTSPAP